jgi:hypothetical protein
MWLRVLFILGFAACASGPPYRLTVRDRYELGEDPTISVAITKTSDEDAVLVITRPSGSTVRQKVPLGIEQTNVRFGNPIDQPGEPTFNELGDYRVELRANKAVLAKQEIRISIDRLTSIFTDEEIASYQPAARYTRARQAKRVHYKTYGALYEHTLKSGIQIHVLIEEAGDALDEAWKPYEEEGTLGVIENNHVRFRERSGSVSASWISGKRIIAMRAGTLEDFERGFIAHFLARYPSNLQPF